MDCGFKEKKGLPWNSPASQDLVEEPQSSEEKLGLCPEESYGAAMELWDVEKLSGKREKAGRGLPRVDQSPSDLGCHPSLPLSPRHPARSPVHHCLPGTLLRSKENRQPRGLNTKCKTSSSLMASACLGLSRLPEQMTIA